MKTRGNTLADLPLAVSFRGAGNSCAKIGNKAHTCRYHHMSVSSHVGIIISSYACAREIRHTHVGVCLCKGNKVNKWIGLGRDDDSIMSSLRCHSTISCDIMRCHAANAHMTESEVQQLDAQLS